MTYKETLHIVTHDFFFKLLVPGWALGLTDRLRRVKVGFEELRVRHEKKKKIFHAVLTSCLDVYCGNDTRT